METSKPKTFSLLRRFVKATTINQSNPKNSDSAVKKLTQTARRERLKV